MQAKFPAAHSAALRQEAALAAPDDLARGLEIIRPAPGTITEIMGLRPSCGTGLVLTGLLDQALRRRHLTALIDGRDCFDPSTLPADALPYLLWVRCRRLADALRSADLLLRDGNIPLLFMDLQLLPAQELQSTPGSTWYRLRALAAESGVTLLAITPCKTIPCAHSRFTLQHRSSLAILEQPLQVLLTQIQPQLTLQRQPMEAGRLRADAPSLEVA